MNANCKLQQTQKGAILLVTLTLLFALTILSSFGAKVVVTETRLSSNEMHIAKSSHAADSGIDLFLAQVADSTQRAILLDDADANGQPDGTINGTLGTSSQTYSITLNAPTAGDFGIIDVNSIGCSDGYAGTCDTNAPSHKVIQQYFALTGALTNSPNAALTAKDYVNIPSSPDVVRLAGDGDLVVLTGGAYSDNPATTLISNGVDVSGLAPAPPFVDSNDATLAAMSDDDFFESFFGVTKETFKGFAENINCGGGCDKNDLHAALALNNNQVIWADGDITLLNDTFGTVANPIILIVDGNLELRGGASINGLVYVMADDWDANGAGNAAINGAAIGEGGFDTNGNITITYNPAILSNLEEYIVGVARISGSWIDI